LLRAISALLCCIFLSTPAYGADAAQRLDSLMARTHTFQASFEQSVFDESHRLLRKSSGQVYLNRPGKFRWDYKAPAPHLIVADGERVWLYDRGLEQVTVRNIDTALGHTPALLLTHTGTLHQIFRMRSLPEREGLTWVELSPRGEAASFEWIRMAIDSQQIRIMEMADTLGQVTELRFADGRVNIEIDEAMFTFTAPANSDVIDGQ
jgi:outer membrane lipoprotein carrier protein